MSPGQHMQHTQTIVTSPLHRNYKVWWFAFVAGGIRVRTSAWTKGRGDKSGRQRIPAAIWLSSGSWQPSSSVLICLAPIVRRKTWDRRRVWKRQKPTDWLLEMEISLWTFDIVEDDNHNTGLEEFSSTFTNTKGTLYFGGREKYLEDWKTQPFSLMAQIILSNHVELVLNNCMT